MSLFKERKFAKPLPKVLPNLALQGNKVQVYELETSKLNADKRHGIPIPNSAYENELDVNRAVLLQTLRKKYFVNAKYRGEIDWDIMAIAETLCVLPIARNIIVKLRVSSRKYTDKLHDEEGYYYNLRTYLPAMNPNSKKYYLDSLVDTFYQMIRDGLDIQDISEQLVYKATKYFGLVRSDGRYSVSADDMETTVRSAVVRNLPPSLTLDENKVESEVNTVHTIIMNAMSGVDSAMQIINRNKSPYKWRYDSESDGWKMFKQPFKPKKYTRRVYNELINSRYMSWRLGQALRYLPSIQESIFDTPTDSKVNDLSKTDEDLDIPQMVMPKFIDKKLDNKIRKDTERNYKHAIDYLSDRGGVHGKAKHHRFKGVKPIVEALRKLTVSQGEYGVKPRQVHRIITDRKVFKRRKHVAGGSLMIDCSGSMGFSSNDVKEIVNLLPASKIAGYVGYGSSIGDDYDGDIRYIAQDGRMDIESIHSLQEYGANSIDYDALKWLAKQEEPRIWVSDMQVVGVNSEQEHRNSSTLSKDRVEEIMRFVALNNIIPINEIADVKEFARQYSKFVS